MWDVATGGDYVRCVGVMRGEQAFQFVQALVPHEVRRTERGRERTRDVESDHDKPESKLQTFVGRSTGAAFVWPRHFGR